MTKTKTRTIKQADAEGRIRDKVITVAVHQKPVSGRPSWFEFAKKREWKESEQAHLTSKASIREQAAALIDAAFAREKEAAERELGSTATPGEIELVLESLESDRERRQKESSSRSHRTNELIIKHTKDKNGEPSMDRVMEMITSTRYTINDKVTRETIVFHDTFGDEYSHVTDVVLDNLRDCHPLFAYDDLSDLDDTTLALANTLVGMSIAEINARNSDGIANRASGKWQDKLLSASRDISRHTPHITHAMVELHLNHPERVHEVLNVIAEREMPLSHADEDFIQGVLTVTHVLAEGAL